MNYPDANGSHEENEHASVHYSGSANRPARNPSPGGVRYQRTNYEVNENVCHEPVETPERRCIVLDQPRSVFNQALIMK
jgi:hypothetical protein